MSTYPRELGRPRQIRSALRLYQVFAIVAGIALFVLLTEMLMKYAFKQTNVLTEFWSPIHGVIYMGYAASVANLGIKSAWGLRRIVLNLLAGFVPVVPWVAEKRNTAATEALLQRAYFAGGPDAADPSTSPGAERPSSG